MIEPEPTDPPEAGPPVDLNTNEETDHLTPGANVEREIWRELSKQSGKIDTTATLTGETHNRLIGMEIALADVKVNTAKQADLTAQLVQFAGDANARENRRETVEIDLRKVDALKEAARAEAAAAAEVALAEAEAAGAARRGRTLDKLVDWWMMNWKLIVIGVGVIAGVNIQPLMQAFGVMAPPQVVVAEQAAPAPVVEPDEAAP